MNKQKVSLVFSVALFLLFCWTAMETQNFRELARFFPYYISILGAILTLIDIIIKVVKMRREKSSEVLHQNIPGVIKYSLIICAYLLLIYLVGIVIGTAIFLFSFLYFEAKLGIVKTTISVAVVVAGIIVFGDVMNLYWPRSFLDGFIG